MNEQVSLNNQVLDALLIDYAAGALSQPLEILIETHLAMNPESAKTMQILMQLGGILLEECEPVSLSEDALNKVMSAIAEVEEPLQKTTQPEHSFLPRPISDYIPDLSCNLNAKNMETTFSFLSMVFLSHLKIVEFCGIFV